jgi:hypothetical protein
MQNADATSAPLLFLSENVLLWPTRTRGSVEDLVSRSGELLPLRVV